MSHTAIRHDYQALKRHAARNVNKRLATEVNLRIRILKWILHFLYALMVIGSIVYLAFGVFKALPIYSFYAVLSFSVFLSILVSLSHSWIRHYESLLVEYAGYAQEWVDEEGVASV
jgi:hypothetical protein